MSNPSYLTEKQANKLASLKKWGERMTLARELLDEAKQKNESREELFFNHRKNVN